MQILKSTRALTVACALLLSATAALAMATTANARSFSTGVLDIDSYLDGSSIPFDRTKAAGAKYLKANVYWTTVAPNTANKPAGFDATDPASPGYNWARFDRLVRNANRAGLEVVMTVTNSPLWARAHCTGSSACAPHAAHYAEFARALAVRYSGTFNPGDGEGTLPRVRHFQAWVEPNLNYFFQPVFQGRRPVSPGIYRGMLNAFYDAIKSVRRDNLVLTAGLAPLGRAGATIAPLDFMRRLLCLQNRNNPRPQRGCNDFAKFDIWAVHPYTTGGPTHRAPGPDDVALGDLRKVTRTLRAAERHRKVRKIGVRGRTPIWATEFSYDSRPPDPGGLSNFVHVHWSSEAMFRMFQAGVNTMIWFGYRDEAPNGRPHCEVFDSGLYRRAGSFAQDRAKPFLRAFKFPFVSFRTRRGLFVWGRTPTASRGAVQIQLHNGRGGFRPVGRLRAGAEGVFQGQIRVRQDVHPRGKVRARTRGGITVPFSLRYPRHFYQPPFGRCVGGGGGRPNSPG